MSAKFRYPEKLVCPVCKEAATVYHGYKNGDGHFVHRWVGCDCIDEWSVVTSDCPACMVVEVAADPAARAEREA